MRSFNLHNFMEVVDDLHRNTPLTTFLPKEFQRSLMSDGTSRHNKLWLLTGWKAAGYWFEWKWQGEPGRSRMMFAFEPGAAHKPARSYEEDILPTLLEMSQ